MKTQYDYWKEDDDRVWAEINFERQAAESGWIKIKWFYHAMGEIDNWLSTQCQGRYDRLGHVFVFELPEDATLFTLRWR